MSPAQEAAHLKLMAAISDDEAAHGYEGCETYAPTEYARKVEQNVLGACLGDLENVALCLDSLTKDILIEFEPILGPADVKASVPEITRRPCCEVGRRVDAATNRLRQALARLLEINHRSSLK
jgi:hypothetical protein